MHKLFEFSKDKYYRLMLDMAKEMHTDIQTTDIISRFNEIDKRVLFNICHEHDFDGIVGCFAKKKGIELPDYWEEEYERQSSRQSFLREKAKLICEKMDDAGIPMVILKNGGIMISMIPEAVKCPMEDIDSLIQKKDFYKAHEVLESNGFVFSFRSDYEEDKLEEAFKHGSAEYFFQMPDDSKMWFELSWRAIDGRWIRPDLEPNTDEFIARSFVVEGTKVHVLSAEDNLLQVCIHTAKHSYCRAPGLRLHLDVDRIVAHNNIDWTSFIKKVKETHVCKSTYLSLYIPSVLFDTPVPEWVLEQLITNDTQKLLNMLANAGLAHPKGKKFSKIQFLRFQTMLYDSKSDILHTLFPSRKWMVERFDCKNVVQLFFSTIIRAFDLVGIRKRKK